MDEVIVSTPACQGQGLARNLQIRPDGSLVVKALLGGEGLKRITSRLVLGVEIECGLEACVGQCVHLTFHCRLAHQPSRARIVRMVGDRPGQSIHERNARSLFVSKGLRLCRFLGQTELLLDLRTQLESADVVRIELDRLGQIMKCGLRLSGDAPDAGSGHQGIEVVGVASEDTLREGKRLIQTARIMGFPGRQGQ